ncbi:MAG: EboA domain-containing protein [Solirubrobacteraceae bacterium]
MIPLDHHSLERALAGRNGDASQGRASPGFGRNGDASHKRVSPGFDRSPIGHTSAPAGRWLDWARGEVERDPGAIATLFPAVGRAVGRAPLDPRARAGDVHAWTVDAAVRTLLLVALGPAVGGQLTPLYRHGDTAERCGILRALAFLSVEDAVGVPLVEDALRTNDLHLIAASLGPYAFARLDDAAVAQAVLKCVFVGVPLAGLAGVEERATPDMAGMLARYAHERVAAGRAVPDEVWPLIDRFPPSRELAAIEAELSHQEPGRRRAAQGALAGRAAAGTKPES